MEEGKKREFRKCKRQYVKKVGCVDGFLNNLSSFDGKEGQDTEATVGKDENGDGKADGECLPNVREFLQASSRLTYCSSEDEKVIDARLSAFGKLDALPSKERQDQETEGRPCYDGNDVALVFRCFR